MPADVLECPIDGCTRGRKDRNLMCYPHWRRVPKELRDRVWETARRMWRDLEDEAAYQDWREAADAAIAAVEMKEADGG